MLYCSLLENLNIATAFIDAPDHILMMFDSGVPYARRHGLRLGRERYIRRGDRYWIPVEVTKLGEGSFMEAWDSGINTARRLLASGDLSITDVRQAWADFPYSPPADLGDSVIDPPGGEAFERSFFEGMRLFDVLRRDYVKRRYIQPLSADPGDHRLRLGLVRTKIESEDLNDALVIAMPLLDTEHAAEAHYLMGCAHAGQDDLAQAIASFERAAALKPENQFYKGGLEVLRREAAAGP